MNPAGHSTSRKTVVGREENGYNSGLLAHRFAFGRWVKMTLNLIGLGRCRINQKQGGQGDEHKRDIEEAGH
jgi:hypothetical protein